jgi:surface protein
MRALFKGTSFNVDISGWDTSSVNTMESMFESTPFNKNISGWDTSSVTSMKRMFLSSSFNQDIGNWDTSSVNTMESMFESTPFNKNIGGWDTSSVTSMKRMFFSASFNQDIGGWDTSSVNTMESMFQRTYPFNQDIGNWNTSSVEDMSLMFTTAPHRPGDVLKFNYAGSSAFNQNLDSWDVSNVKYMYGMFAGANKFNGEVKSWNVQAVRDFEQMFDRAVAFDRDIRQWNIRSNAYKWNMLANTKFIEIYKCNGGLSTCYVTTFSTDYAFLQAVTACFSESVDGDCECSGGCGETFVHISKWNTTGMKYFQNLFYNRASFNQDIGAWDTSAAVRMDDMFSGARAFNRDISGWIVGSVRDMSNMFNGASSFDVNISSWVTRADANTTNMFEGAVAFLVKYACATSADGPPSSCSQASQWASTLKHWFDFSSSTHVSANSEGAVTSFSDKMGNAASLVVHGSPTYVDMSSRYGFHRFINFTRDGDRLAFDALGGLNPEVFIAYNVLQYSARGSLFGDANNGYGFGLLDGESGDDIVAMGSSSGPILAQIEGATFGLWHVAHLNFAASNAFITIDGSASASFDGITGRYTATNLSAGLIGGVPFANHFAPNYFGEVMIFDSPLNQTMRDVITRYLASKWKANATDWYSLED